MFLGYVPTKTISMCIKCHCFPAPAPIPTPSCMGGLLKASSGREVTCGDLGPTDSDQETMFFFQKWGYHNSWMVYFMENPIEIADLGIGLRENLQGNNDFCIF